MPSPPPTIGRAQVPGGEPDRRPVEPARGAARAGSGYGANLAGPPGAPVKRKIKPRWGRITLVAVLALALLVGLGIGGAFLYAKHIDSKVHRIDAFSAITGGRPAKTVAGAQNILLLGSDSRDPSQAANNGGWRSDTIILMHITASHDKAYLISIPRDTYVYVPKSPSSQYGNTMGKINSAFSWGGVPLTVETVEGFTGVRIDHVALINFDGFKEVTDALGGVDLYVDQTITSIHKPHRVFTKGTHHMNGAEALDWVRQRKQFAQGDFARVKHQQEFLRAIMNKAASTGTMTNPAKLNAFLNAMTKAVVVDKDMDLVGMALQFRGLRSSDMTFLTNPSVGTGTRNGESVVLSNKTKAISLYDAVKNDKVAAWLAANK